MVSAGLVSKEVGLVTQENREVVKDIRAGDEEIEEGEWSKISPKSGSQSK